MGEPTDAQVQRYLWVHGEERTAWEAYQRAEAIRRIAYEVWSGATDAERLCLAAIKEETGDASLKGTSLLFLAKERRLA